MMRKKSLKRSFFEKHSLLVLGSIVIVVAIALLLIFGGSSEPEINDDSATQAAEAAVEVLQEAPEDPVPVVKESSSKERIIDDACEDYLFYQGDSATYDGVDFSVDLIGKQSARMTINGEVRSMNPGDIEKADDVYIQLLEDDFFYFQSDHEYNQVSLRIGCSYRGEDPNDKYVREKGAAVCEALYSNCQAQFDVEE